MSKAKGGRRERGFRDILQEAGYDVKLFYGRRYGPTDAWGLYDLIGVRPDDPVLLVQVKSNAASGIREWVSEAGRRHQSAHCRPLFAVCEDYQGWRVMEPVCSDGESWGYETLVDGRDSAREMGAVVTEYFE